MTSVKMPEGFDFGAALRTLREGRCVSRAGWNGRGMWLTLIEASGWCPLAGDLLVMPRAPFIAMKCATGELVPWLASQTDLLAVDWCEVPAS